MTNSYTVSFTSKHNRLEDLGGKGVNLSLLYSAGFSIPNGFTLITKAYKEFIKTNELKGFLLSTVAEIDSNTPLAELEEKSKMIRARFVQGNIPKGIIEAIKNAYQPFEGIPVAVRSSATAEDLPEMSFAGQQDTFLHVLNQEALLIAVKECWSSLWTARAIGYRARNKISQQDVSLAVVVQKMIPSEVSGVLFTANPLTGSRLEVSIDAAYGLGEALVSGQVEPDNYIIDSRELKILNKTVGAKALAMHGSADGGLVVEQTEERKHQALTDAQIISLTKIGIQIVNYYDSPQDIEWALTDGKFYILQSRPITSLFPIPEGLSSDFIRVYFSFASVQGLFNPLTPLGQDAIRLIFAGGSSLFGYDVNHENQGVIKIAGERLWGQITSVIRHPIGKKILPKFFSVIDPVTTDILEDLINDSKIEAGKGKLRLQTFFRLAKFIVPTFFNALKYWGSPIGKAKKVQHEADIVIEKLAEKANADPSMQQSIDLYREIFQGFVYTVPHFIPAIIPGFFSMAILTNISKKLTGSNELVLQITRGLPHNVTTLMDLALWDKTQIIRADPQSFAFLQSMPADKLALKYLAGQMPAVAQQTINEFMNQYGMRGVGEIDFGTPRWRETPGHIIEIIRSYLQIEVNSKTPDIVFKNGKQEAKLAIEKLENLVLATPAGKLKAKIVRALAIRMREFSGLRESPKFHIIKMMGIAREHLLTSAARLVVDGRLKQADDVLFLYLNELQAFIDDESIDITDLVAERRSNYAREMLRKRLPLLLVSDGRTFYESGRMADTDDAVLQGNPVSPGITQGIVRVVLDPMNANLLPGEIMVCVGTDPAWTPLFLVAGGLVMEVGGMMTHGAIVAREYGIPAVVGLSGATTHLHTGQRIQVNGSTGQVVVMDEDKAEI